MTRIRLALLACITLLLASATAEAGRPRGLQILDTDLLVLPYIEQQPIYKLTYARAPGGEATLVDQSLASPERRTPLGFTPPIGSDKGSYTATPGDTVWAAFASTQGIRVYDLGDLAASGPLAPSLVDVIPAVGAYDPGSVSMGIIAILIGLVVEERPALSISDGTSNTMLGFDGERFRRVELMGEESIWYFR
jgi:hypothetical protein